MRARVAARTLCGFAEEDAGESSRLLSDLRDVFGGADALHTEAVLAGLCKIAEGPWADWHGRNLTARDLSRLLAPYGVRPCDVKIAGTNKKGYRGDHLHDAWSRYLPYVESDSDDPSATSALAAELERRRQVREAMMPAGSATAGGAAKAWRMRGVCSLRARTPPQ